VSKRDIQSVKRFYRGALASFLGIIATTLATTGKVPTQEEWLFALGGAILAGLALAADKRARFKEDPLEPPEEAAGFLGPRGMV
jgi:hypothetical protein